MLVEAEKPAELAIDKGLLDQANALRPSSPAAAVDSGTRTPSSAAPLAAPAAAAPGADPTDYSQEAAMLVDFVCEGVGPLYPTVARMYPADVRAKIAAPLGRVFAKYQLTFLKVFMRWEPEITLAMVTVPLIAPTVQAVRADNAAAKAAAIAAKQKADAAGST